MNAVGDSLYLHLKMHSIAEYYDTYQLRETAVHSIRHILVDCWDPVPPWYPNFLEAAFATTRDAGCSSRLHTYYKSS